jgi:hypothetical protein
MLEAENHPDAIQQLSLFQDENVLLNGAIQDLRALRLEEAMKAFYEYRDIYHAESVDEKLKLSAFLSDGLARVSGAACGEPGGLCRLWEDFENYAESIGVTSKMEN